MVWRQVVKVVCPRMIGLLLLAFFLHAVALNGIVTTGNLQAFSQDKKPVLITFDVCGHGTPANTIQHFDFTVKIAAQSDMFVPVENIFSPTPDDAVATADPGEIEKPPKA
jgi:hypothetical protein